MKRGRNGSKEERSFLSSLHPLIPRPALFSPLLRKDPTRKHRSKDGQQKILKFN